MSEIALLVLPPRWQTGIFTSSLPSCWQSNLAAGKPARHSCLHDIGRARSCLGLATDRRAATNTRKRKGDSPMLPTTSEKTNQRLTRRALSRFLAPITILFLILPVLAADKEKDEDTLRNANLVLQDMINSKDISQASLSKANCVLILPGVKKFGFGVGGSGGRGPLLCRRGENFEGKWSAPAMYSVGGASIGLQVGG